MGKIRFLIIGLASGFALGLITQFTVFRNEPSAVEKIRANEITIFTIDTESMEPVEAEITFSTTDLRKPAYLKFPHQITRIEKGITQIMWIDSEDFPIQPVVSADGYESEKVEEPNAIWWGGGRTMSSSKTLKLRKAQQVAAGNDR